MALNVEQDGSEPRCSLGQRKESPREPEATPSLTGELDDAGKLDDCLNEDSRGDPLEYIMMDTLSHLPADSANKLLKSLQRSAQRAQRAERLLLRMQTHLEGPDTPCSTRVATSTISDGSAWKWWLQVSCGCLVILTLVASSSVLIYRNVGTLYAQKGYKDISAVVPHECKPCNANLPNATSNGAAQAWSNPSGSDATAMRDLTAELESLLAKQSQCESGVQKLRERWRRAAQQPPPVCASSPSKGGVVAGPAVKAPPNRNPDSARVAALAVIGEQQGRITHLQSEIDGLQGDRSRCAKCLANQGVTADCSEALREVAEPGQ